MQIVPVIDVRNGVAVRARGGTRDHYEPILTPLAESCDPVDVARGYLDLFPFDTIYLADLDGIEGRGRDLDLVPRLRAAVGQKATLWVDCGLKDVQEAADLVGDPGVSVVLGSESLASVDVLSGINDLGDQVLLSLDFQGDAFMGPQNVLERVDLWPHRIIVMTLARIGGSGGPDMARLAEVSEKAPQCLVYAAGGIRNHTDAQEVKAAGGAGVLVASALHNQKLKADDLKKIISL